LAARQDSRNHVVLYYHVKARESDAPGEFWGQAAVEAVAGSNGVDRCDREGWNEEFAVRCGYRDTLFDASGWSASPSSRPAPRSQACRST